MIAAPCASQLFPMFNTYTLKQTALWNWILVEHSGRQENWCAIMIAGKKTCNYPLTKRSSTHPMFGARRPMHVKSPRVFERNRRTPGGLLEILKWRVSRVLFILIQAN